MKISFKDINKYKDNQPIIDEGLISKSIQSFVDKGTFIKSIVKDDIQTKIKEIDSTISKMKSGIQKTDQVKKQISNKLQEVRKNNQNNLNRLLRDI
ncbi:MAG: hypothetical protein ACOCQD_00510 [archaeon]